MLFLPENEVHELGILYLNYELNLRGYKSIYLGQSVPIENLEPLLANDNFIEFVTYATVEPSKEKIDKYIQRFKKKILNKKTLTSVFDLEPVRFQFLQVGESFSSNAPMPPEAFS